MELHEIGYNHSHDKTFAIDRPNGIGSCWILLLIKTPAVFMQNGKEVITKENSFILYTVMLPSIIVHMVISTWTTGSISV
jgi:AraC family transcriptional regulator of arabinose operon